MMEPLSASEIVALWELGDRRSAADRALLLAASTAPELSLEALTALSIEERDRRMLALRIATFGPLLEGGSDCPSCAVRVELSIVATDLLAAAPPGATSSQFDVAADGLTMQVRSPTVADLDAAATYADAESARHMLIERCVSRSDDSDWNPHRMLSEAGLACVSEQLAQRSPTSDVCLAVTCPSCGQAWDELLDLPRFFWQEIASQAARLLSDVTVLARAYGWTEHDVLGLSDRRREYYLEAAHL
jgi:hypothetical protein